MDYSHESFSLSYKLRTLCYGLQCTSTHESYTVVGESWESWLFFVPPDNYRAKTVFQCFAPTFNLVLHSLCGNISPLQALCYHSFLWVQHYKHCKITLVSSCMVNSHIVNFTLSTVTLSISYFVNFLLCQFPLCQHWPNANWLNWNWQSEKLTKWE